MVVSYIGININHAGLDCIDLTIFNGFLCSTFIIKNLNAQIIYIHV